jgi:hypothetical protein
MPATSLSTPSLTSTRLDVPRHLQDCYGYCGQACVMMVHCGYDTTGANTAQHSHWQTVRQHMVQTFSLWALPPIFSTPEGLLQVLAVPGRSWVKVFNTDPWEVAKRIIYSIETRKQPCLILINKGAHWVVAFGVHRGTSGALKSVLTRDPAWGPNMPLLRDPKPPKNPPKHDKHAAHTQQGQHLECTCLKRDKDPAHSMPTGTTYERIFSVDYQNTGLLSTGGLKDSTDYAQKNHTTCALALVAPISPEAAAELSDPKKWPPPASPNTGAKPGGGDPAEAALLAAREYGLSGPDAHPEWRAVFDGGRAGTPILVKTPGDPDGHYYLVPIQPRRPGPRSGYVILDARTLHLHEAALLDHWTVPSFPTKQDAEKIAAQEILLPDGRRHRFSEADLHANTQNLVWQASAASILPYAPLREFTARHPITGVPVSIYITQGGEIYTSLGLRDLPATASRRD